MTSYHLSHTFVCSKQAMQRQHVSVQAALWLRTAQQPSCSSIFMLTVCRCSLLMLQPATDPDGSGSRVSNKERLTTKQKLDVTNLCIHTSALLLVLTEEACQHWLAQLLSSAVLFSRTAAVHRTV